MLNGDASSQGSGPQVELDALDASAPVRRGRGRPPGSLNRPKPPPMSPAQRQALKNELSVIYRQAIIDRALVETRARGVAALIQSKLGKDGLAEIQAEVVREHEGRGDADGALDDATRFHELAA